MYAQDVGPERGARGQLSKGRSENTVEAFSDISYASTKGYRSVQGQVYYYAGSPVMWSTSRQPFPTQSTAESELVSLCEALAGGRATVSLIAAIRDEKEENLRKHLWGDNAASISLATGEGQGSWRTRHLRIRAAILRSALNQGEWQLSHLSGKELVADSFTKIVEGVAFEKALQDLGLQVIQETEVKDTGGTGVTAKAKLALLIGSTLVSSAAAAKEEKAEDDMFWLWLCGIILMSIGAVCIGSKAYRASAWLVQRLQGSSGSNTKSSAKEHGKPMPMIKMLQRDDDDDDDEWELCSGVSERSPRTYAPQEASEVDVQDLHQMMQQSRAIVEDPYNKMHGRTVETWHQEDEREQSRLVQRAYPEQLPRRRKKKGKGSRQEEDDEAMLQRMQQNLFSGMSRLYARGSGGPTSLNPSRQSGSEHSSSSAMPLNPSRQSGLEQSSSSATSLRPMRQSGPEQSGSSASSLNPKTKSGFCEKQPRPEKVAATGSSSSTTGQPTQAVIDPEAPQNPWNLFQHNHRNKGWGSEKMRAEYWKTKATGKPPRQTP